jgi:mannan polymerase II complex MNN10 subunit
LASEVNERVRANGSPSNVTWESAKAKSDGVNGYPSFSTQNNGFFNRHYRKISSSLPHFNLGPDNGFVGKDKQVRGRWMGRDGNKMARVRSLVRRVGRKLKLRGLIVIALILMYFMFYWTRKLTISSSPTNNC